MKKAELIKHLAKQTGLTIRAVTELFSALDLTIINNAAAGVETVLGLVTITTVDKAARVGRNPLTGAEVQIPAKRAAQVKISKTLKDAASKDLRG